MLVIEAANKSAQTLDRCGVERFDITGTTIKAGLTKQTDITFANIQSAHELRQSPKLLHIVAADRNHNSDSPEASPLR